jgi:tetratricopeptide (TPR) repeat protein
MTHTPREEVEARRKEDVVDALGKATSRLRARLGESMPSIQKYDVRLVSATTSSLDALRAYGQALSALEKSGDLAAVPFFKRAIELDPNFALAYEGLSVRYYNLGQTSLALQYATKAYELRDRVTELEKLRISTTYFDVTGQLQNLLQDYDLWIANYPRDRLPHRRRGVTYCVIGQWEKALPEFQQAMRLGPDSVVGDYASLGSTYIALNRLGEAKTTLDQALAHQLDDESLRVSMYYLGFLQGDVTQMEQQVAWGVGQAGSEDALLSVQSDTEAFNGRLNKARELSRKAVDSAIRADAKETAAYWRVNAALREAELGHAAIAKEGITDALTSSSGRDVQLMSALALARMGDTPRAAALVKALEKSYATDTILKFYWLPAINSAIELNKGNSSQALMYLKAATPYQLGIPLPMQIGTLYPVYLRGQAYLLAHDGSAAAAEFQKVLDHRGIVLNFATGALAHLQLGRAYAMTGDTAKAKTAYQDFLALWKDADSDLPIFRQAKAEYAALR